MKKRVRFLNILSSFLVLSMCMGIVPSALEVADITASSEKQIALDSESLTRIPHNERKPPKLFEQTTARISRPSMAAQSIIWMKTAIGKILITG